MARNILLSVLAIVLIATLDNITAGALLIVLAAIVGIIDLVGLRFIARAIFGAWALKLFGVGER